MSDQHIDPAGNTQQFRAFAQRSEQEISSNHRKKSPLLPIIAVVVVIAVIGVAAFLLLK
ncbi:hypothetical protein [Nonomuraea sediminis]|uniref:hypothetical protein n=1 Tax=Nonomuraea sediminis TaxID=2835864 RepID=UPI001BDCA2D5|nr:hypothetical protein [Nonomuraea sediminis]